MTSTETTAQPRPVSARLLARNTLINLAGQGAPLLIAFLAIPLLMKRLGVDRFGVLTLAWMVIGYFSLFDLGLSRAMTRQVAEANGTGDTARIPSLVRTSLILQVALGALAGVVLLGLAPVLAERILRVPPGMTEEARNVLGIMALSLPIMLASTVLRGVLEAGQRFDLIALLQVPGNVLLFLVPLLGAYGGYGLPAIVLLLVLARLAIAVGFAVLSRRVFPILRGPAAFDGSLVRPLFSYGGWITVSNIAGPFLLYIDRFVIGAVLSVAAVSYYTAPYEVIVRLMVFPTSLIMVLFPAFSAMAAGDLEKVVRLYTRSMKYLFLVMGPLVMVLILFARSLLGWWLGPEFAGQSTLAFQILAAGMLLTPVQVSVSLLHAIGRPDVTAKFYLLELCLYLPVVWLLVGRMGIAGAALAWSLRALLDTILLLAASRRMFDIGVRSAADNGLLQSIGVLGALGAVIAAIAAAGASLPVQAALAVLALVLFAACSWRFALDRRDRDLLLPGRMR